MSYLIIIPARKNSKRIKNKNIIKLGKKKLIQYTIEFAIKIANKKNICVSTDSSEIKEIAKKYGIFCPKLRPKYLSKSHSSSADVCLHEIKNYEKSNKINLNYIILLQPTTPFRSVNLFNETKKMYLKNNRPTYSISKLSNKKYLYSNNRKNFFLNNKKNYYEINGSMYFISRKDIFEKKSFFKFKNFNTSIFKSKKYSIDIDTVYDFEEAKKFL